ncbi:MAG: hypothetical protein AB7N24_06090 [Dehalococcoidia bacterium]
MSEKYVMGSPQWLAALHACMLALRPAVTLSQDITLCEVYRNVPASIQSDNGTVAFTARFRKDSNEVDFEAREASDATVKLRWEYDAVLPVGRLVVGNDPKRAEQMMALFNSAMAAGKASIEGEMPPEMMSSPVHDMIASLTA